MKRFLVLALTILCLMASCGDHRDTPTSPEEVRITTQDGVEYAPLYAWIFSYDNGLSADGTRYGADHIAKELADSAPIQAPFSFNLDGKDFSVYDLQGNTLSYRCEGIQLPTDSGTYICAFEATFGNNKSYQGYLFYFKFTV